MHRPPLLVNSHLGFNFSVFYFRTSRASALTSRHSLTEHDPCERAASRAANDCGPAGCRYAARWISARGGPRLLHAPSPASHTRRLRRWALTGPRGPLPDWSQPTFCRDVSVALCSHAFSVKSGWNAHLHIFSNCIFLQYLVIHAQLNYFKLINLFLEIKFYDVQIFLIILLTSLSRA